MTKELDTTTNISKLHKEISNILNTARANALPKPEELAYQIKMDRLLIEKRMKSSEEENDR